MKYRPRRKPTDFSVVLISESGDYPVVLTDVSSGGMKVSGVGGFVPVHADVTLALHNHRLRGQVKWVHDETVGISLNTPLTPKLEALMTRACRVRSGAARAHW